MNEPMLVDGMKELVRQSNEELYNHHNLDVLDAAFVLADPEAYKRILREFFAAFPDMRMTVERLICEGDVVVCQMTFTGTHRGSWKGIAPTGRTIIFVGAAFDRIVDGKRVDHVGVGDFLGVVYQLGGEVTATG